MNGIPPQINRLDFYPAETVFSWASRYHLRFGNAQIRDTYEALFGTRRIRVHPFLPQSLMNIAGERKLDEIVREHTLYPLFAYFGYDPKGDYIASLTYNSKTPLPNLIANAGLGCEAGHYFCPLCVDELRQETGLRIYTVHPQFPGIDSCPIHGIQLIVTENSDFGIDRKFQLPTYLLSRVENCASKNRIVAFKAMQIVNNLVHSSFNEHENHLQYYRSILKQLGLVTRNDRIRESQLRHDICRYYNDFQPQKGLEKVMTFKFLGHMLRENTNFIQHPFHHLLLQVWLDHVISIDDGRFLKQKERVNKKQNIDDLVLFMIKSGFSKAEIKAELGCVYSVIERVAALNGIKINRVPSATPPWYQQFLIFALLGRHRQFIADAFSLKLHVIETEISKVPGLPEWRHNLAKMRRLERSIYMIKHAVENHPDWSRQNIKQVYNKEFFYLYKYAPQRLEELLPPKMAFQTPVMDCSEEDERIYLDILKIENIQNMPISKVSHLLLGHGRLLKRLEKLPKSKHLLMMLGVLKEES
ncbi:TnsD family Tn7-like transposition protein [Marinomonas fungiae]|uniref:Uncharacterized protein n=1 Tax=Marinomonas fungiae TaxID=1137284 RepID=A0A0K6ILU8_9GAMM|nr:TnsD family Tn7-like transposition protein [Marinomonas fungiae]CUB04070.1 hypothetical protein Ga0061065_105162 [Marinomonas fungiae]